MLLEAPATGLRLSALLEYLCSVPYGQIVVSQHHHQFWFVVHLAAKLQQNTQIVIEIKKKNTYY